MTQTCSHPITVPVPIGGVPFDACIQCGAVVERNLPEYLDEIDKS